MKTEELRLMEELMELHNGANLKLLNLAMKYVQMQPGFNDLSTPTGISYAVILMEMQRLLDMSDKLIDLVNVYKGK